jgi:hypothetical protein
MRRSFRAARADGMPPRQTLILQPGQKGGRRPTGHVNASKVMQRRTVRRKTAARSIMDLKDVKTMASGLQGNDESLLFGHERAVSTDDDLGLGSYRDQGDIAYYSTQAIADREHLQDSIVIRESITRFWDIHHQHAAGLKLKVNKPMFILMELKIAKALFFPDEFTMGKAKRSAEEDWAESETRQQQMDETVFANGLFELADLWTDSLLGALEPLESR